MALDASIFANALRPLPTAQDYTAANLANQQNALKVQSDQQTFNDQNALRQATMQLGNDPTQNLQTLRQAGLFAPSQAYQKALYDNQQTQSTTAKNFSEVPANAARAQEQTALAGQHTQDTNIAAHNFAIQKLAGLTDPSQVPQWINDSINSGAFTPQQGMEGYQSFKQAVAQPGGFDQWKQGALQSGQSAVDTLKQQQAAQLAQQSQAGENARNAATNATSRANNQDMLAKDYAVAGVNSDGTPMASMQSSVDAIGRGDEAAPTGAALRNPRIASLMDQVNKQYAGQDSDHPLFNAGNFVAKQQALKSFATGKDGQAVQTANTVANHMSVLQGLMQANQTGDIGVINAAKQKFQQEFGVAAPANTAAAIALVGPELSKLVVSAGGGQGDRATVEKVLRDAQTGSPAIQAGAFNTINDLVAGRMSEVQRTYQRTTGKNDFAQTMLSPTLRNLLAAHSGAPTSPGGIPTSNAQGWVLHQDAQGNKAYVSPDGKQFQQVGQ